MNALRVHPVGLEANDSGVWSVLLGSVLVRKIDEATEKGYG